MRSVDLARCREVRHGWFVETVTIPSPDPNHQRPDEAQLQNQAERREARLCQPTDESHTHERNGEKVKPVWPRHQMFSRPKPESVLFHESECARRCGGRQRKPQLSSDRFTAGHARSHWQFWRRFGAASVLGAFCSDSSV